MLKFVSSIGDAAYKTATKTGLAAGTEQPPYPCALPLPVIDDVNDRQRINELRETVFAAAQHLLHSADHAWSAINYIDPDQGQGGDLVLFTRPHIGPYNFAKATMSFFNCGPEQIARTIGSDDLATRQKYSVDLLDYRVLAQLAKETRIEYLKYWAPPPVQPRTLIYLTEQRYVAEEDTWYVFGCSVDYPALKKEPRTIRASCLWAWELSPIGPNTFASYASCMSANGWAPTFILGWMKSEIGKELVSMRRLLYGQAQELKRTTLEDYGVTREQLQEEEKRVQGAGSGSGSGAEDELLCMADQDALPQVKCVEHNK